MPSLDKLRDYKAKRDFTRTSEPAGGKASRRKAATKGGRFVVQMHDATRLHYDFRIEMDGVLKSWAVTRGPSNNPADKRLAVRVEDHPLDYASFEGTIPAGAASCSKRCTMATRCGNRRAISPASRRNPPTRNCSEWRPR